MKLFEILFWPITAPIKFIQNNFKATLLVLILILIFTSREEPLQTANLKQIELNGPILDANKVLEQIESAKNDQNIKGVLFLVNSPGGAVAPSVEIAYAIKELNSIKPVVSYASGTMASGSYYASIWSSYIIANPGSTIGSIGVILQSMDASELMEKIGIKTQISKVGKYKEVGTPTREWEQHEKEELYKVIKSTYDMFVSDVASARNLDINRSNEYADAHIFTSIQAKDVGLLDEVATLSNAKAKVQELAKVNNAIWEKENKMDKFMDRLLSESVSKITNTLNNNLMAY
jgi:protease-4